MTDDTTQEYKTPIISLSNISVALDDIHRVVRTLCTSDGASEWQLLSMHSFIRYINSDETDGDQMTWNFGRIEPQQRIYTTSGLYSNSPYPITQCCSISSSMAFPPVVVRFTLQASILLLLAKALWSASEHRNTTALELAVRPSLPTATP
jgi:hypothetical protein